MTFKIFWWKSYVSHVKKDWVSEDKEDSTLFEHTEYAAEPVEAFADPDSSDKVVLRKNETGPIACDRVSLYNYIQMGTKIKRTKKQLEEFEESLLVSASGSESETPSDDIGAWMNKTDENDDEDIEEFDEDSDQSYAEFNVDSPDELVKGPKQIAKELDMKDAERVLKSSGWIVDLKDSSTITAKVVPTKHYRGSQWKSEIARLRENILAKKFKNAPSKIKKRSIRDLTIGNDVITLSSYYLTKFFKAKCQKAQKTIDTGMDPSEITKGISGFLRQEFRELELLNEITRRRFENELSDEVRGVNRRELIAAYREYIIGRNEPDEFHPALFPKSSQEPIFASSWKLIGADANQILNIEETKNQIGSVKTSKKRRQLEGDLTDPNMQKKRRMQSIRAPSGMKWDSVDYSCAYDAVFSCLYAIWVDQQCWQLRVKTRPQGPLRVHKP
ncbi:hypothetical protein R3P38DRAFT_2771234 [Favolaschia claudopus]|uniref:Uncharacterized protein n=1 Tax=Favolaschia claudopus TaxID=2862362 RepID=A0AAW0CCB3_9AGAR